MCDKVAVFFYKNTLKYFYLYVNLFKILSVLFLFWFFFHLSFYFWYVKQKKNSIIEQKYSNNCFIIHFDFVRCVCVCDCEIICAVLVIANASYNKMLQRVMGTSIYLLAFFIFVWSFVSFVFFLIRFNKNAHTHTHITHTRA